MSRSVWKGPYIKLSLVKKVRENTNKAKPIKIWSRSSTILPSFIGYTFNIHNGKSFVPLLITQDMIGHKFGEFALTRKIPIHKVKKNLLKKK